jgi:hypothetical protein
MIDTSRFIAQPSTREDGIRFVIRRGVTGPTLVHPSGDYEAVLRDAADLSDTHAGVWHLDARTPDGDVPLLTFEWGLGTCLPTNFLEAKGRTA